MRDNSRKPSSYSPVKLSLVKMPLARAPRVVTDTDREASCTSQNKRSGQERVIRAKLQPVKPQSGLERLGAGGELAEPMIARRKLKVGSVQTKTSYPQQDEASELKAVKTRTFRVTNKPFVNLQALNGLQTYQEPILQGYSDQTLRALGKTGIVTCQRSSYNPEGVSEERTARSEARRTAFSVGKSKLTRMQAYYTELNLANSITIDVESLQPNKQYLFYLNKYNNPKLVRKCFLRRTWWKEVSEEHIKRCNLVWTQYPIPWVYRRKPVFKVPSSDLTAGHESVPDQKMICEVNEACSSNLEASGDIGKVILDPHACVMINKLSKNVQYGHKNAMYLNLRHYCEVTKTEMSDLVPLSFYVDSLSCHDYLRFKQAFASVASDQPGSKNLWLIKPAEYTFGGHGIEIASSIQKVEEVLEQKFGYPTTQGSHKFIIQRYIERPLLYDGRKFDIRAFCLITCYNRRIKAFWHEEGYIRTASRAFSLADVDNLDIHLTNDCKQKTSEAYGAFERANKLLYDQFFPQMEVCLRDSHPSVVSAGHQKLGSKLRHHIVSQMRSIAVHLVRATAKKAAPNRGILSFELVGLDFMVDTNLKAYLIEANNSPSMGHTDNAAFNTLLESIVDDVFTVAVDPVFQAPPNFNGTTSSLRPASRFQLVYEEDKDANLDLGDPATYGYQER